MTASATNFTEHALLERLERAPRIHMFLDYDGTLAEFAPTPDIIEPDATLISLLTRLADREDVRLVVVSGRRLPDVERLLPVPGALLAGSYGIELLCQDGERLERAPFASFRPLLDRLKPLWSELLEGRERFHLEDKGWTLAIHARRVDDREARAVLETGRATAEALLVDAPPGLFSLLNGYKFLEIGPLEADKGRSVRYILERFPWPGALPLFIGDDEKDEPAFAAIKAGGGVAILVSDEARRSLADYRLSSPLDVHRLLEGYLATAPTGPAPAA